SAGAHSAQTAGSFGMPAVGEFDDKFPDPTNLHTADTSADYSDRMDTCYVLSSFLLLSNKQMPKCFIPSHSANTIGSSTKFHSNTAGRDYLLRSSTQRSSSLLRG